ncbi:hypothetical protein EF847_22590 [Actinobacteria bacterium YIM 96077]|uniref:Actinobacteria/chloroflexi VLRF1 release factor domain-containing protein n=1 Tax=Phytoactinopolyspora halophila TaxID=1981511 RepID=A0A329QTX3_9ACTN|nr:acVLRF1 family peptidyl-tRNA hydrolase [Phytoactinopolyspora halophila]AYY15068.1 hypothetical protein EF847_22590 [Actinobacteria bacterium YIM 96077]RAW14168.1 hypothetical protein DPM12_10930 [Phytoactinopolyspora halophila]
MPTKRLSIPPERLERWLAGFADRHGPAGHEATPDVVTVSAADGACARCTVPLAPLAVDEHAPYGGLIEHARRDRRVGVVLVRRGGYAAGIFEGRELVSSKVGSRHVQGRTAAGGRSQQRFARRRDKQAREAFDAAADVAARIVLPHVSSLDAVVCGGDRAAVNHVLADARLSELRDLVVAPFLPVPDPRLAVLREAPDTFRAVRIELSEPDT